MEFFLESVLFGYRPFNTSCTDINALLVEFLGNDCSIGVGINIPHPDNELVHLFTPYMVPVGTALLIDKGL